MRKTTQGKPCFHYRDGFAVFIDFNQLLIKLEYESRDQGMVLDSDISPKRVTKTSIRFFFILTTCVIFIDFNQLLMKLEYESWEHGMVLDCDI